MKDEVLKMKGIVFDFWYGDKIEDCDNVKCYFCDLDGSTRGNFYKGEDVVGDFTAESMTLIAKAWNDTHDYDNRLIVF